MSHQPTPTGRLADYARALAGPLAVATMLAAIAAFGLKRPGPKPASAVAAVESAAGLEAEPVPEPPAPPPPPPSRPAPEPDRVAIAAAQDDLDAASRDRARADHRAAEAADRLKLAQQELARLIQSSRTLASRLRDPSFRINQVRAQGEALRVERDRLQGELATLAQAPRPRGKPLVDKTPVARPPSGEEFHFELRRGRITFIDLEGLLDHVRTDAKVQLRLAERLQPIGGTVGPVGSFSIQYEMSPDGLDLGDSLLSGSVRASYSLTRLGDRAPLRPPRRDDRPGPPARFRLRPRRQPPQPVRRRHHLLGLSRRLHPLQPAPRQAPPARLPRCRPPLARGRGHPRQSGRLALGRPMRGRQRVRARPSQRPPEPY